MANDDYTTPKWVYYTDRPLLSEEDKKKGHVELLKEDMSYLNRMRRQYVSAAEMYFFETLRHRMQHHWADDDLIYEGPEDVCLLRFAFKWFWLNVKQPNGEWQEYEFHGIKELMTFDMAEAGLPGPRTFLDYLRQYDYSCMDYCAEISNW